MSSREDAQDKWIQDGTIADAPVTDSTPVIDTTPTPEFPVVAESVAAPVVAEPVIAATPETVAAAATEQEEFIEGMYKGQPYKIPKFVELPLERKGVKTFASIEKIRETGMFEQDYRIKRAEEAAAARNADLAVRAANARALEAEKIAQERADQVKTAMGSPEEREKYEGFVYQYNNNESFRKTVDDAREGRLMKAEAAVYSDEELQTAMQTEADKIRATITDFGQKYPRVDPEVVRMNYSRDLQGEAPPPISTEAIEWYYKQEDAKAARVAAPLESELGTLKAQVASLLAAQAAGAHNSKTERQIARTVNPVAAPASGSPPAPVVPKITGKTTEERTQSWLEQPYLG
jgi:hypothetical protein